MKKRICVILLILMVGLALSACGEPPPGKVATYTKEFGTYKIPTNWEEIEEESQQGTYVYLEEETDPEKPYTWISVGSGINNSAAGENEAFREDILEFWDAQMEKMGGGTLEEDSMLSEQGYYVFIVKYTDIRGVLMTQYFIPGEYTHCLIQNVNGTKSKECDRVTRQIVDSFRWSGAEVEE